jgi:hypothetical protein
MQRRVFVHDQKDAGELAIRAGNDFREDLALGVYKKNGRQADLMTRGSRAWENDAKRHSTAMIVTNDNSALRPFEAIEPSHSPLDCFSLRTSAGREAFLEALVAIGEPGLFAAVKHVWSSLENPVAARCTQMGIIAGTGGAGKRALYKVLRAFIIEWLGEPPLRIPMSADRSLEEWHKAVMTAWNSEHARERAVMKRYAAILNGDNQRPSFWT